MFVVVVVVVGAGKIVSITVGFLLPFALLFVCLWIEEANKKVNLNMKKTWKCLLLFCWNVSNNIHAFVRSSTIYFSLESKTFSLPFVYQRRIETRNI